MFQEKFGGISRLYCYGSKLLYLVQDMVPLKISSQEYQVFLLHIFKDHFSNNTYLHILHLFGLKGPNKRRRSRLIHTSSKGFSDIPPASTLGKVYEHYNSTNDLTPRSNILASIGNTSSS